MHPILALSPGLETALFVMLPLVGSTMLALGIYQVVMDSRKVSRKKLMERLKGDSKRKTSKDVASILKKSLTDTDSNEIFASVVGKLSFIPRLQTLLDQANVPWRATRLVVNLAGAAIGAAFLLRFLGFGIITSLGIALAVLVGPIIYLSVRRGRRMSKLTNQLPDVFAMMSQALRAGHSLASAIQLVAEQMPDPISSEFARVFHEQNLGIKIEDALLGMADRVDSLDVRFFVTAVLIQRTTGGDLAEVLDKIGQVIQERIQLFGQVKGLTAEGRLSGWVLFALPILVFLASMYLNPDYAGILLSDPRGKLALFFAGGMQIMGMAMIRMIVNIKVEEFGPMSMYAIAGLIVVSVTMIVYALMPNKRGEQKEALRRRMSEGKATKDPADLLRGQSKQSMAQKMLQKVAPLAVKPVMMQNDAEISKLRIKLANAGFRRENTPTLFLASKTVLAGLIAVVALIFSLTKGYDIQKLLGLTLFGAGVGFMGPNFWLGMAARSRMGQIRNGLPDSLDLLVITVESGLGLDAAIQRVGDELKNVHPIISEELQIATLEAQMGIPRSEALSNTAVRCGTPEMRSLVAIINQAEKFGTSVAQALRRQADALRVKRRQAAEEKAQKTTVKLMLPLIMFIFPAIFVVLGAPAAFKIIDAFSK